MSELLRSWVTNRTLSDLLSATLALTVIYLLVRTVRTSLGRHIVDLDARYRARKFAAFAGYVAAILVLALIFSDRVGSVSVAFGVAGAGIAFALQEVIASVAGWIAVASGGFYSPGDRVQLGGIRGDVIDISILRTTLMEVGQWVNGDLYNGRIVRIANSAVFKDPVFNYSADFPFVWDEIRLPVRYGSDWKYCRELLRRIVDEVVGGYAVRSRDAWKSVVVKYRIEDAPVDPMITLSADENWIDFTIRYIVDYRQRRITKDELFTRILEEVDKSQGRVRIATASFEVLSTPPLQVKVHQPFAAGRRVATGNVIVLKQVFLSPPWRRLGQGGDAEPNKTNVTLP
jgi:small-conductance mechanosensitive channel